LSLLILILILKLDFNYLGVLHLIPPKNLNQKRIPELLLKHGVKIKKKEIKKIQYKFICGVESPVMILLYEIYDIILNI
jgi:hypothetical protein